MRLFAGLSLLLLNSLILYFVLRERDRSRVGLFLIANTIALILYGTGLVVLEYRRDSPVGTLLPALCALMVPAGFLLLSATHPEPISPVWGRRYVILLAYLPAIGLMALADYRSFPQHPLGYQVNIRGELRDHAWLFVTYVYFLMWLLIALVSFAKRHAATPPGPLRDLTKHMIGAIFGILVFAALFWFVTREGTRGVLPSPTLLGALLAQVGIFVAIRQGDFQRPFLLSRWLFYTLAAATTFLVVSLVLQLYEIVAQRPLIPSDNQSYILAIAVILVLFLATLPTPQAWFDRVFFRRAWEYRKLVLDAQRELRETQERLRRAERLSMVGELAARIAHEIKNPLGPIKGYTEMLREKIERQENLPQREQMLSHLEVIAEEVAAIDRKVHTLLDIARRPMPERHVLDPNVLAERTATVLRLEVAATPGATRRVVIDSDLAPNIPEMTADRTRLEEALLNLGRNALEALEGDGRIILTTREEPGPDGARGVAFLVEDNGRGLSPQAQERLFTPFFTDKPGGTGLGLAIARSHADEHHGELTLRNREPRGVRARLWVPLEPPRTGQDSSMPTPAAARIPNVKGPIGPR